MRLLISVGILLLAPGSVRAAEDSVEALIHNGLIEVFNEAYFSNTSSAVRYFGAALQRDPKNLRARWEMLVLDLWPIRVNPIEERAPMLRGKSVELSKLLEEAGQGKDTATLHLIKAELANFFEDFTTAEVEIKKAIALEPKNSDLVFWNARIARDKGARLESDSELVRSIELVKQAQALSRAVPSYSLPPFAYELQQGLAYEAFSSPRDAEAVSHFREAIRQIGSNSRPRLKYAYRELIGVMLHMEDCAGAKKAIDESAKQLGEVAFKEDARSAEFCLRTRNAMPGGSDLNKEPLL